MPKARLLELYAHGLGVIDDARLEFGTGFNVLTGETGAGKTLLLGALGLCLGLDTASSRAAITSETRVAALFARDGEERLLSRESTSTGRLRSLVDGATSSAEALRALAEGLIVINGQHDSLSLRDARETLRLIDRSGGVDTDELEDVRRTLREARRLREGLGGDPATRQRELDFLAFQLSELDAARLASPDELMTTLEDLTRLTTLRDSQATVLAILDELDAEGDEAILARYATALGRLPADGAYDEVRSALTGALVQAREALRDLAGLADPGVVDDAVLAELDERARVLQQVARKYGGSLAAALETREDVRRRLEGARRDADRLDGIDREIRELEERELTLERRARADREFAAERLTATVREQLPRVALEHASLRFDVGGDDGSDARILFAANPGLPEGPLSTLASGGELSRVLLAISLETADEDAVAVFDEVDAGLGGHVAQQIGECLYEVGRRRQVLAVTHLASVAARADRHFVIEKFVEGGLTTTTVRTVTGEERVGELARMLAGHAANDASRALARRLLENGPEVRVDAHFSR
jgi:DNA repair protein RecN (Recombination protein N)